MPTLVFDPLPAALEPLLAERAKLGLDRRDEVWQAAHGVGKVVLVDPDTQTVEWLGLDGGANRPTERSAVIDTDVVRQADRIDWPS